jgi:two-component system response regulator HydG
MDPGPSAIPDEDLGLIGRSPQIRAIRSSIRALEGSNLPVLLLGEAGTGKRVVATALGRSRGALVSISCGMLSGTDGKVRLSGSPEPVVHEDRFSFFASAAGGTLFLDDLDALAPDLQVHVSRLLTQGSAERLDCRVVLATNYDLVALVANGAFSEELFYQLNTMTWFVPPLRQRKEDIPLLVDHFLARLRRRYRLTDECRSAMLACAWPGNIRQLESSVHQMVILKETNETRGEEPTPLDVRDLPPTVTGESRTI